MKIHYTACTVFDKNTNRQGFNWEAYLEGTKLKHLIEVVSLDCLINGSIVEVDIYDIKTYHYCYFFNHVETGLYSDLEFVLQNARSEPRFNLLACIVEPVEGCSKMEIENFEFMGYDLLDKAFEISALTNCGGFPETLSPSDHNQYGIITDFEKAYDIKKRLLENNPHEFHADCNVIALWRHKTIGRTN